MNKIKKIFVFLVLVIGCVCCFCSCSCSSKKPPGGTNPDSGNPDGTQTAVYYNVNIIVHGISGAGAVVSSTGGNQHTEGSSPIYTILPNAGYAIETITIDGAVEYTHLIGGYKEEPWPVLISEIAKDIQLAVTFKQMEYAVECNIVGDDCSGTIVSSTESDIHLGATSPFYTITPADGYCVYSLEVDGEPVYDYETDFVADRDGATREYVISEPFEIMSANHNIDVEFRKLVNIGDIVVSSSYYKNMFKAGHEMVEDDGKYCYTGMSAVTFEQFEDYEDMPVGSTQKLQFEFSSLASRVFEDVRIHISFDGGETFIDDFSWRGYFNNASKGLSYNPNTKVLQIKNLSENIEIKFIGVPMTIDLTIYDANNATTVGTSKVYLFSDTDNISGNLYWYYCLSSSYHLSNLYIEAEVEEFIIGGDTMYSIYLDETMLMLNYNDEYEMRIVLIFSTEKLTN